MHEGIVYRCLFYWNANAMVTCSHDATVRTWSLTPDGKEEEDDDDDDDDTDHELHD
jgi:hypothetical protein